MQSLLERFGRLLGDEDATATVEYALLVALVVIASLSAWVALGGTLKKVISSASNTMGQPFS
jgi:Flp pilus assembly pilin Flp